MPNPSYMDYSPKYKGLIDRDGMRNKPAVVYPASVVDSEVVRADHRICVTEAPIDTCDRLSLAYGPAITFTLRHYLRDSHRNGCY